MSWKNVRDHYRIGHTIQITESGICIGSPYIHDLIVVGLDGVVRKRADGRINEDLHRYLVEMDADPGKLRQLVLTPDVFGADVSVYTYEGGDIIEKRCETPGWPNVTHDGRLMYNNTFSTDKSEVVKWAKRNADLGIESARQHVADAENKLAKCRARLAGEEANRAKLDQLPVVGAALSMDTLEAGPAVFTAPRTLGKLQPAPCASGNIERRKRHDPRESQNPRPRI